MRDRILWIIASVCVLGVFTGVAYGQQVVKVGTIFPRSGPNAMLGEQAWRGADLARRIVNEAGGVNGKTVQFVDADAPNPQAAVTEAERLISKENVKVMIGSLSSGNALSIASVTERSDAILWETSGISDDITKKGFISVLRTCDMGAIRGQTAVALSLEGVAKALGISPDAMKIAMVYEDSAYGTSQYNGALAEMKKRNKTFVAALGYNSASTDLSSVVLRLKQASPDVLISVGYINDVQLLCNGLRGYKATPKVIIGGGAGYTDPQFQVGQHDFANGVIGIDMPSNIDLALLKNDKTRALGKTFRERYNKEYGEAPPLAAEVVFMGAYALINDVLPRAADLSADSIRKAAMSVDVAETINGWSVKFDATGQNVGATAVAYQWQEGLKRIVWPERLKSSEFKYLPLRW
jgi:branched-chain amino acid transport system substrate-binding protein